MEVSLSGTITNSWLSQMGPEVLAQPEVEAEQLR